MTDVTIVPQKSGSGFSWKEISAALRKGDIALGAGVLAIIVVLILPMPPWALDILLALSIISSV
jgi:flagellar biosynthesis protein FlhA